MLELSWTESPHYAMPGLRVDESAWRALTRSILRRGLLRVSVDSNLFMEIECAREDV